MLWQALWLPGTFLNAGARPPIWAAVLSGAATGIFWGAVARVFMRLISEGPRFSVSGTATILIIFTLAGAFAGLAFAALRRRWRWWLQYPLRALAFAVTSLLVVFQVGALTLGVLWLPAPLLVVLGVTRVTWPWIVRGVLLIVALAALLVVSREFMGDSRLSGLRSAAIVPFLAWLAYGESLVLRVCLEPVARPQPVAGLSLSAAPTTS